MFVAVVPAYNEEKMIGMVVKDLLQHVDRVVVVDDGSKDQTASVAKEAGATVLRHEINRGQGAALETGHEYARLIGADLTVDFDADGQFAASAISDARAKLIDSGADLLLGSRFLIKDSNLPLLKRLVILPMAKMISRLFGAPQLTDAHNGFRMYTKKALNAIRLSQDRMAHATEIPALAKRHGLSIVEFPIAVTYHEYGQRGSAGIKIVEDLIMGNFVK